MKRYPPEQREGTILKPLTCVYLRVKYLQCVIIDDTQAFEGFYMYLALFTLVNKSANDCTQQKTLIFHHTKLCTCLMWLLRAITYYLKCHKNNHHFQFAPSCPEVLHTSSLWPCLLKQTTVKHGMKNVYQKTDGISFTGLRNIRWPLEYNSIYDLLCMVHIPPCIQHPILYMFMWYQ